MYTQMYTIRIRSCLLGRLITLVCGGVGQQDMGALAVRRERHVVDVAEAQECIDVRLVRLAREGIAQEDHALDLLCGDERADLLIAADTALDCGPQINPERIRAQMEGGVIMGLSLAMSSEITFEKGRVKQSNFHDYEVLRHASQPQAIRCHLVGPEL